jgi:hypothetical protein
MRKMQKIMILIHSRPEVNPILLTLMVSQRHHVIHDAE